MLLKIDWIMCFVVGFLIIIITLCVNAYFVINHENAHFEINKDYGYESKIEYDFLWQGGQTVWLYNASNYSETQRELHNLNEIVGYNVSAILLPLSIIASCLVVITISEMLKMGVLIANAKH